MRRILLLPTLFLLALAALCFLLSAGPFFGRGKNAGQNAPDSRPIVVGTLDDIKTLDPGKMSWANDIRTAMALFEGLTMYDTRDRCQPIPAAAESWDISPDRLTYTFHLRPTGRWSNGDPVTAADFLFAWKRALTPATGADYIGLLKGIRGAEQFTAALEKKQPSPDLPGVRILDPLTLQVQLNAPCTYFLDLLAMPVFFPLHERSMQPFLLADGVYNSTFTQPPHLISNGPFHLVQWRFKRDLTLQPNPFYWDQSGVHCPELRITPVSDSRAALLQFQHGTIDLLTNIPSDFADALYLQQRTENKWPELHMRPVFGTYYYIFNTTRKPFDDKRVRKALAMAIDRKKLTDILMTGEVPLGLIVPPNTINGYASPPELPYDIATARKLLADAGFPNGQGIKPIELLYNSEARHSKIAQAVGQMWQTNLGLAVTYRGLERGSFGTARRDDHDFDIARGGWYGDYPDPTTWLDLLRSSDGNNDGRFNSPAYDALMARSDAEPDPAKRFALLRQAEDMIVNDEAAFIPLYQYADGMMYDDHLQGAPMNSRTLIQLKWIRRAP
jgi:oligopeptide transport system substrate-binding protein